MTLKDIANEAGVSVSTVSRVLNGKHNKAASKEVQDKIWSIVREKGYTPNRNAQDLRKATSEKKRKKKRYFACVYARSEDKNDMFFSELANAIEQEAYKHDYILKYSFYAAELDPKSFRAAISSDDISGVVILGRFNEERMNSVAEAQKNVVYVGLNCSTDKHDTVFCDGYLAGRLAMDTLMKYGHTEIVYIGEKNKEKRYQSYCKALEENHIAPDSSRVVNVKQVPDGGYHAVETLIKNQVSYTAIFCANDATAIGAMKALKDHKVKVPDEVSVISIDDIELAQYFTPMLTTVHIPITELGKHAVKILIDRIESGHTLPVKIQIPFYLVKRESCGVKKKNNRNG